jgi:uncharacterized membrane protein YhhN
VGDRAVALSLPEGPAVLYDHPPTCRRPRRRTRRPTTTALAAALLAAAAVVAVADWIAVAQQRKPLEYAAKPATLALLVGVAVALHPARDAQRTAFVVALVLSLAGDVFLMLPRDLFAGGLASFLLGHIAYAVGLRAYAPSSSLALPPAAAGIAAIAALLGTRVVRGVRRQGHGELVGPVLAYIVVLSAMVVLALARAEPLAALGGAAFLCSDAVLAWNRFVRPLRRGPLAVIVSYHLAQALLVLSLLR